MFETTYYKPPQLSVSETPGFQ